MKKKTVNFRLIYLSFVAVLVILVAAALFYVSSVLKDYEASVPENVLTQACFELSMDEWDGKEYFWEKYNLPEVNAGRLESGFDVKEEYVNRLTEDGVIEYTQKRGVDDPDRLVYIYSKNGVEGAEITLRATSKSMTKLGILTYRTWEVESIKPILEKKEYTLTVPTEFTVKINGLELSEEEIVSRNEQETTYNTGDLYLVPEVDITDAEGNEVSYQIANGQILAEFYYFTFLLEPHLTVEVNGQEIEGAAVGKDTFRYEVKELSKPQVIVKDLFGNEYEYIPGEGLPIKHHIIEVDSRYKVLVNGEEPPKEVVTVEENPEYAGLEDYVAELPKIHTYVITILDADAKVRVITDDNLELALSDEEAVRHSYLHIAGKKQEVPMEVASKIDVLAVAQEWSLFMSNDRTFEDIAGYMVKDCYQYEVAKKYANSVDRKFFSSHTLANPAFTDSEIKRFVWVSEDCFYVDISFVKHMILKSGKKVDDDMNDRFYFVKWDDTEDGVDNSAWKIVRMKEIVNNGY